MTKTKTVHVYIHSPANWSVEDFRRWATVCAACGERAWRWRWDKRTKAFRCADCDGAS